jgi:glycolate oxidase iron-sulfur subunit
MSNGGLRITEDAMKREPAFDAHRPPSPARLAECVHCGYCLPACPTYVLWGEEMDSPRGRILLMEKGVAGQIGMSTPLVEHIDACLGCMACMTACPSAVQYDELLEATRAQVERRYERGWSDRAFRGVLMATFPHPRRLRVLAALLGVYQRSELQRLVRTSRVLRLLPERVQAMESLMPAVPRDRKKLPAEMPATGEPRMRVGVMTGCVQGVFYPGVNAATARVLTAEGCEVAVPAGQPCCGALPMHLGEEPQAQAMARDMIAAFERANVDAVVVNAAGCGSAMKEYGRLLEDDPAWRERAAAFAAKCVDVSELLARLGPRAVRHPVTMRLAYQDACHLRHAQKIFDEPRALLRTIPGLELVEMAEPGMCCGAAGVYNLLNPATGRELGDRKSEHLLATGAQAVASANPGCLLQMTSSMARAGKAMPAMHVVEVLDASLCGLSAEELMASH